MTERAQQLHAAAQQQIDELLDLASTLDDATLRRPGPGREKLGDGTVAASARHTADNYQRIAAFVFTGEHGQHGDEYVAGNVDLRALLTQLSVTRRRFDHLAELTDTQLDAIPRKDSFRFCDGHRTLDQVLANLLKHQRHQLDALGAAVLPGPSAT